LRNAFPRKWNAIALQVRIAFLLKVYLPGIDQLDRILNTFLMYGSTTTSLVQIVIRAASAADTARDEWVIIGSLGARQLDTRLDPPVKSGEPIEITSQWPGIAGRKVAGTS
jgi:hypothetical protein